MANPNKHFLKIYCWLITIMMIVVSSQPIACYKVQKVENVGNGDDKTVIFEKKSDATTPKAGVSIRFILNVDFYSASRFVVDFVQLQPEDVKKTTIPALTAAQTNNFVKYLRILFRYYIAVNAP